MQYLLLGLVVVGLALAALHGFKNANPTVLARQLRRGAGAALVVIGVVLSARGAAATGLPVVMVGLWLLTGGGGFGSFGAPTTPSAGQTSRIVTDTLELELEHDTGIMRGRVLTGIFAGRAIESLAPEELALLWQDCRVGDPRSAQLVEAYLDRVHPTWREDVARGEQRMGQGPGGRMTVVEAREILGVAEGATAEEIRRAHRELMLKLHPDRGGSTYLAAKVNEAKDVLLGEGH
jgi:hypothetical protein